MSTKPAVAAILAKLATISDHDAIDGAPTETPTRRYFCVYDQTGRRLVEKYKGTASRTFLPFQVSVVARTTDGLRDSVALARGALLDWAPVAGASPIVEVGSNPIISTGEGNDVRLTAPLTMHCYLPKET